jgi:hypothetical protein
VTPKQLQAFLDRNGLSQRGAAATIGIGERTMRRYVAGDLPIPLAVEYALRWVASVDEQLRHAGIPLDSEFAREARRYVAQWIAKEQGSG